MDAAEKYKNRHRAVIEHANGAMFNVAELDAWAVANKFPLSFEQLFANPDRTDHYAPEHHYVSFEILADTIAWNIVSEDASPDDARQQLKAAHDTATPDDPVSRLRDLVMVRYNNALLSAVYDGKLNLFDTLAYGKVDVEAARLGYNEDPDAFLEGSRARIIARRQPVTAQSALNNAGTVLSDEARPSVTDGGEIWTPEEAAPLPQSMHPQGMDVISLSEAMNLIALNIDVPKGRTSADDEPMWRASEAAKTLYECLHNATGTRPRWMEAHPTIGKPLASDAVADEGMAILLHAAGWYDRETEMRARHTLDCVRTGLGPAAVGAAPRDPNAGQWDYGKYWMREHQIGFIREELSGFLGIHIGEIAIGDQDEARLILGQKFERLDRIAWAMVVLASSSPTTGEARYRQILGVTQWLKSLGLQYRTSNRMPASQPKGVPVAGMDVREYQYLAVADVRAAAIEARCWPIEEKETPPIPLISDFAPRPVRLPNASRVNVEWLVREIAFALVEIPDDERLATLEKETPDGPGKWNFEPLTGDDWRLIREICGSKPPAPCSRAQFETWRAPFDTAPNRPDWDLRPEFKPSNEMQAAQSCWSLFNVQHLQQIRQKAERKEFSLITPAGIETSDIYDNAGLAVGCLRIADAKAYLDQCCIAWEVASVGDPAPSATKPKKSMTHNKPNWSVWHCMHKVSLFDAICLSYDIVPGAATLNPIENGIAHLLGLDFVGWDVSREIANRLSIARSHAGTGGTLQTVTGDKDGEVHLTTFVEWAVNTMKWAVPDELRALASTAQHTIAPPEQATGSAPPAEPVANTIRRHSLKSRWNALDTAIDKAIKQAENDKTADVLLVLRTMALDEVSPFTGETEGGTLFYTNDKGERVPLTRDGLDGRLRRRRKAS